MSPVAHPLSVRSGPAHDARVVCGGSTTCRSYSRGSTSRGDAGKSLLDAPQGYCACRGDKDDGSTLYAHPLPLRQWGIASGGDAMRQVEVPQTSFAACGIWFVDTFRALSVRGQERA